MTIAEIPIPARSTFSGSKGCKCAPRYPPQSPPTPQMMPIAQSGAMSWPDVVSANSVYVAAPTIEVTKVDVSAAGATSATGIPRPTRIGLSSEPPPMP
jgi:hypothetical protein